MDAIDSKIISLLSDQGRLTWADLASNLGLSRPAVAERVKKLEERGVIKGYTALIDAKSVGVDITAFVFIILKHYKQKHEFLCVIDELEEVQECHHVAGDEDFILKVRCKCISDLDRLICEKIKLIDMVDKTKTTIVLNTDKETIKLPLNGIETK